MENYFNYFTEIEECFRRAKGAPVLLSTLDWALIESWKDAGVPIEAVLTGIERAFEKFHKRPNRFCKVNSLAYCTQEVMRAAHEAKGLEAGRPRRTKGGVDSPFSTEEIVSYLRGNAEALVHASESYAAKGQAVLAQDFKEAASELGKIAEGATVEFEVHLEDLERKLTALEEKLTASLTHASSAELLAQFKGEIECSLAPYRRNLGMADIDLLERQFVKKRLFQHYQSPRFSLFYM